MFVKTTITGAVVAAAMAVGANAATIDFTSASTGHSGTVMGINWTMSASGVLNNSQLYDGVGAKNAAQVASGLSFQTDGYGVGAKDDEITTSAKSKEWITISFAKPVLLKAVYWLDLFIAANQGSKEVGQVTTSNGDSYQTSAVQVVNGARPGFAGSMINSGKWITSLTFSVLDSNDAYGFADAALAGVEVAPVPVPAAGALMVAGLGGLAALRRRKKA